MSGLSKQHESDIQQHTGFIIELTQALINHAGHINIEFTNDDPINLKEQLLKVMGSAFEIEEYMKKCREHQ